MQNRSFSLVYQRINLFYRPVSVFGSCRAYGVDDQYCILYDEQLHDLLILCRMILEEIRETAADSEAMKNVSRQIDAMHAQLRSNSIFDHDGEYIHLTRKLGASVCTDNMMQEIRMICLICGISECKTVRMLTAVGRIFETGKACRLNQPCIYEECLFLLADAAMNMGCRTFDPSLPIRLPVVYNQHIAEDTGHDSRSKENKSSETGRTDEGKAAVDRL